MTVESLFWSTSFRKPGGSRLLGLNRTRLRAADARTRERETTLYKICAFECALLLFFRVDIVLDVCSNDVFCPFANPGSFVQQRTLAFAMRE